MGCNYIAIPRSTVITRQLVCTILSLHFLSVCWYLIMGRLKTHICSCFLYSYLVYCRRQRSCNIAFILFQATSFLSTAVLHLKMKEESGISVAILSFAIFISDKRQNWFICCLVCDELLISSSIGDDPHKDAVQHVAWLIFFLNDCWGRLRTPTPTVVFFPDSFARDRCSTHSQQALLFL